MQGTSRTEQESSSSGGYQLQVQKALTSITACVGRVETTLSRTTLVRHTNDIAEWARTPRAGSEEDLRRVTLLLDTNCTQLAKLQNAIDSLHKGLGETRHVIELLEKQTIDWRRRFAVDYAAFSDAHMLHQFALGDGRPAASNSEEAQVEKLFAVPKIDLETGRDLPVKRKKKHGGNGRPAPPEGTHEHEEEDDFMELVGL